MEFTMNKIALSVAAVLVGAIAISPTITSKNIEQDTLDAVAAINEMPFYKAELVSSDFGWLHSSAKIKVGLDFSQLGSTKVMNDELTLNLALDFEHGVVLASGLNLSDFSIKIENQPEVEGLTWDKSQPLYQLDGAFSLVGNLSYQDKSPKITYKGKDGELLEISQYQGYAETVNGKLKLVGNLPAVTIETPNISMHLKDTSMNTLISSSLSGFFSFDSIPVYDSSIEMASWDITTPDSFKLNMEQVSMAMSSTLDKQKHLAHGSIAYGIKKVVLDEQTATDLEFVLETNNLDEQSYLKLNKLLSFGAQDLEVAERVQDLYTFVDENLLNILAPEPEFNITSFKGTLPEGSFDANFHAKLEKVEALPEDLTQVPFWLGHLNASSDIKVAKPLLTMFATQVMRKRLANSGATAEEVEQAAAEQAPSFIAMLEAQGAIVPEQDFYTLHFKLADKVAMLNGNEIPLPQ